MTVVSETTPVEGWAIRDVDFPASGSTADQFRFLLGYAVLAPSGHNTQPWLFRLLDDGVELHADRRRALPVVDPHDRELIISCGAALGHLRVALAAFGHEPEVARLPDETNPDLLARVTRSPGRTPTAEQKALTHAIPARRTNRQPFANRPIPAPLLGRLREDAAEEHAQFVVIDGEDQRVQKPCSC